MQKAVSDATTGQVRPDYQRSNIVRTLMTWSRTGTDGHACGDSAHRDGRRGGPAHRSGCGAGTAARHQDRGGQRVVHHRGHRPHDAGRDPPEQGGTPRRGVRRSRGAALRRPQGRRRGHLPVLRDGRHRPEPARRRGDGGLDDGHPHARRCAGRHHRPPDHRHRHARGNQSQSADALGDRPHRLGRPLDVQGPGRQEPRRLQGR